MNEYFVIELDHKDQVFNTYTIQSDLPIDQVCGEFARHMMDDNFEKPIIPNKPIHGLRHDEVTKEDFESIAQFGRIVKNYQKLKRLEYEI